MKSKIKMRKETSFSLTTIKPWHVVHIIDKSQPSNYNEVIKEFC